MVMADDVMPVLLSYSWPGNVRELKSMMQELVVTCPETVLRACHLSIGNAGVTPDPAPAAGEFDFEGKDYHDIMREMECRMLREAIARFSGNMTAAARMLRMDRSTIFRKIRDLEKHGLKLFEEPECLQVPFLFSAGQKCKADASEDGDGAERQA